MTVTGVYARASGDFVGLDTLTLDTVDYSGLLANATVSINNVDAGVTVTSITSVTVCSYMGVRFVLEFSKENQGRGCF